MRRVRDNRREENGAAEERDPLNAMSGGGERASSGHGRFRSRGLKDKGKTHPTIQAKHNQMYLITSLAQKPPMDGALINQALPRELLLRIFSLLDMVSLCRCAQTCRYWNLLALDGSNWMTVDFFDFQKFIKGPVVENLAKRCGGFLKDLSLRGCENIQDSALRSFTRQCPNIERLSLYKCKRVTDMTCENLGKNCHRLQVLNLENCGAITDRALRFIADGCKKLEYINISWCDAITNRGISFLLKGCPELQALIMKGCEGVTDSVFNNLADSMDSIIELDMNRCFVTDDTVQAIANGAARLEYLCLSQCPQITDRSLNSLAQGCKRLTDLELANCNLLSDVGFGNLAKNCKGLMRLDLEDCSLITDQALHAFANHCPQIVGMTLSHCEQVTDDGVIALCQAHKDTLEVLELDNCPMVTDAALLHMKNVKNLKRVDLYDCQSVSKEAINRLKQQRPVISVHAYFAPPTPPVTSNPPRNNICRCCTIL
ncbi:unnamed protein product, partial [Mesorhabditis spiculigera]